MLLYVWTLGGPFVSDDLHLLLKAERYLSGESDDWRLYRFADTDEAWNTMRERGTIPWWLPESGRLDFLRPVSEAAFLLDVRLFGRNAWGYRLTSLAIFATALGCVHWMFMMASKDAIRAGVATFFFGISQTVAPPVTWICNRQDLLVVVGVSLAAGAYWAIRQRPLLRYVLLALGGFTFALFSKEVAIALAGVICAHELIARRKGADPPAGGKGITSIETNTVMPHNAARELDCVLATPGFVAVGILTISAMFLAYYVSSRPWVLDLSGIDGSPTQAGTRLPLSLLLYAAVWTIGFPVDALHGATDVLAWIVGAIGGVLLFFTIRYLRRSIRGDAAAIFFILWAILFIAPGLRAMTFSSRTLCIATIGWAYLLSTLLVPTRAEDKFAPYYFRQFLLAANGIVSVGCTIGTVLVLTGAERAACDRLREIASELRSPLRDGDVLIVSEARSMFEIVCAGERLEYLTDCRGVGLHYLQAPDVDAEQFADGQDALIMQARGDSLLGAPLHRMTLGEAWRPQLGQSFSLRTFTAEVAELDADGNVTRLRFNFPDGLRSPGLHFHPPTLIGRDLSESVASSAGGTMP